MTVDGGGAMENAAHGTPARHALVEAAPDTAPGPQTYAEPHDRTQHVHPDGSLHRLQPRVDILRTSILLVAVLAIQIGFIASYLGAFHAPRPRAVPIAVAPPPGAPMAVIDPVVRS